MKMSRDSIFYRSYQFWRSIICSDHGMLPNTLCSFFFNYIVNIFFKSAIAIALGIVSITLVIAPTFFLIANLFGFSNDFSDPLMAGPLFIDGFFLSVVLFLSLIYFAGKVSDYVGDISVKSYSQKLSKGHPNIFWEYLKAKKQKVCPLIEYI